MKMTIFSNRKIRSLFALTEVKFYIVVLTLFMVVPLLLYKFTFITMVLEGNSMYPTLKDGTVALCIKVNNPYKSIERNDFVSLAAPDGSGQKYVKRVVGLPNEIIEIRSGYVYVNDVLIDSSFVENENFSNVPPTLLGDDEYYVLGDNRAFSNDSREFGPIKGATIQCKYLFSLPALIKD